jgi:muramoyltetrapeptide carboxypeptidase
MNRKDFLQSLGLAGIGAALPFGKVGARVAENKDGFRVPPYLQPGALIGITSPAGYMTAAEMQPAIQLMESWGFRIRIGSAIGKRDFTRGGTDDERLQDLQAMLDDPDIQAIMCARGGYGSIRIVDRLEWSRFKKYPKWLIGFSDITVLHNHIHNHCRVASIHSKMTNSFPDDWSKAEPIQVLTINSIREALSGTCMCYEAVPHAQNKQGEGTGVLIGGNLKTIETLSGSASDINTDGKILFVEDTGEYLYSIDRMFWNLKRSGKLKRLAGLVVGGFGIKKDDAGDEFGRTLEEIVLEKVMDSRYPVCFDFPVGHQRANYALKCGVRHQLRVSPDAVSLKEIV